MLSIETLPMADEDTLGDDTIEQIQEEFVEQGTDESAIESKPKSGLVRLITLIVPAALVGVAVAFLISNFQEDQDKQRQREFMKRQRSFE